MRHAADKVKQALLHSDQDVREAAVYYFANSYSPDPSVMPLVVKAIEQFGFHEAFQTASFFKVLVQTEGTVRWLIHQLTLLGRPRNDKEARPVLTYISALVHADPSVLKNHEADFMALDALDANTKDDIAERIWFLSRTGEELWQDLEEFCETHEGEDTVADDDFDFACRVVEALGRHRDQFADKVLALICGRTDEIGTWKEGLAIRLAGEMKLTAAIPLLMSTLGEMPDDWIGDECHRALTKIDSDGVLAEFANAYAECDEFERLSIACKLEDFHSDLAVQTSLDLLSIEKEPFVKAMLLQSVLFNFATEGIEPARQFILTTPITPDVLELRSVLLTACKLMGETFPEFDAWLADSKNDPEFRRQWHEEHPRPKIGSEGKIADENGVSVTQRRVKPTDTHFQFKITLWGVKPPIWRRIQVKDCTLDKLHEYIQTSMGWTNSHLHQFKIGGQHYGDPLLLEENFEELGCKDSTTTMLSDLFPVGSKRVRFSYEYDFGDGWKHEVWFEGCPKAVDGSHYPICVEGERACPPEDVGGRSGYGRFLKTIQNRNHVDREAMLEWGGGWFDPEEFDPATATKSMKKGLPDWRSLPS